MQESAIVRTDDGVVDIHYQDRWVDTIVNCANTVNKLFTQNTCRVCQVYSDKQLEYEVSLESNNSITSPVDRAALKTGYLHYYPHVEVYRQFLFDEDSVVESVGNRDLPKCCSSPRMQ